MSMILDVAIVTDCFVLVASLLAAVANILVVYCAYRIFRRNHVYTHIIIIMMTLADLFLTAYPYPLTSLRLVVPSLQSTYICASIEIATWLGQAHSGMFLTALNVDRFIFFHWPLKYILLTKKYVVAVFASIVTPLICSITALWATKSVYIAIPCTTKIANDGRYVYIVIIITTFIFPMLSSLALSSYLFVLTARRRAVSSPGDRQGSSNRKVNSLLFIFATSVWTVVAMVPSRVFFTYYVAVYVHETHTGSDSPTILWLAYASNLLMRAYPMINPIITGLICAPYRREFTKMFSEAKSAVLRLCHIERL